MSKNTMRLKSNSEVKIQTLFLKHKKIVSRTGYNLEAVEMSCCYSHSPLGSTPFFPKDG